jgi:hypothetical protein
LVLLQDIFRGARQVARVYAEDVDPEALSFLRRGALAKVTVVPGKPENPMLPPNSSNVVFICDVLHIVKNRPAFLSNIIPALKPSPEGGDNRFLFGALADTQQATNKKRKVFLPQL